MTEKLLMSDFHFSATVSASGVNEKACLPAVFARRWATLATVLFSVMYRQGSFSSSGCSFLFLAACFFLTHSSSCISYILFSVLSSTIHASTTGSILPFPLAYSPAM